jgi:hypothetical protein
MAAKDFDFKELGELKLVEYKKEHCKPALVKKAKAAIIMLDYRLQGKKIPCVMVTFKKPAEAAKAFKQLKAEKAHILKKTGFCKVTVTKGADGKQEITIDIKKGGITPESLKSKGEDLFGGHLKMKLNVIGGTEGAAEVVADTADKAADTPQDPTDTGKDGAKEANAEKVAQRTAKVNKMKENVGKMGKAIGSAPKEKLNANIQKYQEALGKLVIEAEKDGEVDAKEQANIDDLSSLLEELKTNIEKEGKAEGPSGKKMTPERKAKIKINMDKIHAKLEAISKQLKV